MRYSASEKLEIIRLVEQSHLPVRRTLGQIGIPEIHVPPDPKFGGVLNIKLIARSYRRPTSSCSKQKASATTAKKASSWSRRDSRSSARGMSVPGP